MNNDILHANMQFNNHLQTVHLITTGRVGDVSFWDGWRPGPFATLNAQMRWFLKTVRQYG